MGDILIMKNFKDKKRKYIVIFTVISTFTVIGLCITYYNFVPKEEPLIGVYIDGIYSENLPTKGSGYAVDKIVCDNNKNASWDYGKWGIKLSNWGTRSRCNIYFKGLETVTISNKTFYLDEVQKCPAMNSDGTVTVTGIEDTYGYLCKAKDDYGDSYYYRGNVTNNYVKFGTWSSDTPTLFVDEDGRQYNSLEECNHYDMHNCTELSYAGKDMYWRIVRINGDGTVRVIYDGTSTHANDDASTDRQIGIMEFNSSYTDNAYVGYMYGDRTRIVEQTSQYTTTSFYNSSTYYIAKEYTYDSLTDRFTLKNPIAVKGSAMSSAYVGYYTFGSWSADRYGSYVEKIFSVTAGSSSAKVGYGYVTNATTSKEDAQNNKNDSTIKAYLDNWYKANIAGTENEKYLSDNIFCNNRNFSSNNSGTGAGNSNTYYHWYDWSSPILTCPQKNDAFTVSDTSKGNGALTYGIGLITTDEVVLAGGWKYENYNYNYYLYTGQYYWTMSPVYYKGIGADVRYVGPKGDVGFNFAGDSMVAARPVLNLSSDILKNGNGTASDPFHA